MQNIVEFVTKKNRIVGRAFDLGVIVVALPVMVVLLLYVTQFVLHLYTRVGLLGALAPLFLVTSLVALVRTRGNRQVKRHEDMPMLLFAFAVVLMLWAATR